MYEPTLRVLVAQGWSVQCEYPCPGYAKNTTGDLRRIDFVAKRGDDFSIALELKWVRKRRVDLTRDVEKLAQYKQANDSSRVFVMLFGRKSVVSHMVDIDQGLVERGKPVIAEFGVTRFGCRNYELASA